MNTLSKQAIELSRSITLSAALLAAGVMPAFAERDVAAPLAEAYSNSACGKGQGCDSRRDKDGAQGSGSQSNSSSNSGSGSSSSGGSTSNPKSSEPGSGGSEPKDPEPPSGI